ncbi:MAG: Fe-S cluster assembly protein SufD, partial [Boseongicola sp.]|nr:Fe-S cluster assembly protein SufD [Boseongicola sp.]
MGLPVRRQEGTEARIDHLEVPDGAAWATAARRQAVSRYLATGLPGRRDEYWRFTRPDDLNTPQAPPAAVVDFKEAPAFNEVDRLRIVFRDGVFDAEASDDLSCEGLEIERLRSATAHDIHWLKDVYGVLEARGQEPVARPFAALNTAFATDGIVIRATERVSRPVNLTYLHENP